MAERNARARRGDLPAKVQRDVSNVSKIERKKPVAPNAPTNKSVRVKPPNLADILETWDETAKAVATEITDAYGPPDEATSSQLVWYQNGPWKRTIVWREGKAHEFPQPHEDRLEQVVDFEAPVGLIDAIVRFNGSVVVDRTWGELTCHCDHERTNFLALNLANDIATEVRSFEEARQYMAEKIVGGDDESDEYVTGLRFPVDVGDVGDTDDDAVGTTAGEVDEDKERERVGRGRRTRRNQAGPGSQRPLAGGRTRL